MLLSMNTVIDQMLEVVHSGSPVTQGKRSLRAWLHLVKCAKRIEQEMTARFRSSYSSSMSRFDVLAHLYQVQGEPLSTTELAGRLLASRGNITRLLDRMEEDGLIQRRPNGQDRRISDVYLSRKGRQIFSDMALEHEHWADEMFGVLSDAEKDTLIGLLLRVRQRLEQGAGRVASATDIE